MFTVELVGREGFRKLFVTTEYIDIAELCARAIAERLYPAASEARHRALDGTVYIAVFQDDKRYADVVLGRSDSRVWMWKTV
jgi:hypothetical protein